MANWLEGQAANQSIRLGFVAVASGLITAGAIFSFQKLQRRERIEELKSSIPDLSEDHRAQLLDEVVAPRNPPPHGIKDRPHQSEYNADLRLEQLTRTISFLGDNRYSFLRDAFVIIVGLGGVGSHCASALVRSGLSQIRVIDFDQVTLSSLNRHAVATLADVGTPKVQCLRKRLEAVAPWVQWECMNEMWSKEQARPLLQAWSNGQSRKPDFVVDAIDNIDSKVDLLRCCRQQGLRVISSMGAGCKSDPTRVTIGDISASIEDPLSRATRRRLRMAGITDGIPVVYSTEKPDEDKAKLLPLPEAEFKKGQVAELSILPEFRSRILPVLGTMPAVFGYTLANYVIMEITGYPHDQPVGKGREKLYDTALCNLQGLEERMVRFQGQDPHGLRLPLSKDDVGYLVEEIYRGRSVISGLTSRLTLIRWKHPPDAWKLSIGPKGQKTLHLDLRDLVCMTREEAAEHEKKCLCGGQDTDDLYDKSVIDLIHQRQKEFDHYQRYR